MNRLGAILAGRRWYELANERWNGVDGIYGGAFGGPVFVLTHRPPDGGAGPRITFISGGIEEAVASAQSAAGDKDVGIFGARLTQQCLNAQLLDEMVLHVAPVLVGGGVRAVCWRKRARRAGAPVCRRREGADRPAVPRGEAAPAVKHEIRGDPD